MIGQTISRYKILEKLGEGGMGVVYKALDTRLNRLVALKFLLHHFTEDSEERARFVREAQAAAALDHPNIATVYGIEEVEGEFFIVMAYVEGMTLKEKIKTGRLKIKEVLKIAIQVAEGLKEAHDKGIVHRDIKSANVMVTPKGQVKITDFGLAKFKGQKTLTKPDSQMGTAAYMSPEQVKGESADHKSDIFSFGIVLYEMLTGHLPFKGEDGHAQMFSIVYDTPQPITELNPDVPEDLEYIIEGALEKEKEHRYSFVDELLADLQQLKKNMAGGLAIPVSERKAKTKRRLTKTKIARKNRFYVYSGVVILLILLIVGGLQLFPWRSEVIDSIAVLPLENLSGDPVQEYFSDGMTDALITDLARVSALRVISRTSVMQYKKKRKPLPEIARDLNVDAVVEGSVLRSGQRVRIAAQLIDARTDRQLWAKSYERDLRDILVLQSEVARAIVNEISIQLTPQEQERLESAQPVDPKAHELYLLGNYLAFKESREAQDRGLEYLRQALEQDSDYALAYTAMANAYCYYGNFNLIPPHEAFPKAKAALMKALEIDDALYDAHYALAWIKMDYDWDLRGAEREIKRAIELNPGHMWSHSLYAAYFAAQGRFHEALTKIKHALELDPLSIALNESFGCHLYLARQYDQAIEQFQRTIEIGPTFGRAHQWLGQVYAQKKMYDEAIAEIQKSITLSRRNPSSLAALGYAYAISGEQNEAHRLLTELEEISRGEYISSYDVAVIYAGLGEKDKAIVWLRKAFEHRDGWIFFWINVDPRLDILHDDTRFTELVKKVGLEK